jgi:hypothetical protein
MSTVSFPFFSALSAIGEGENFSHFVLQYFGKPYWRWYVEAPRARARENKQQYRRRRRGKDERNVKITVNYRKIHDNKHQPASAAEEWNVVRWREARGEDTRQKCNEY